MNEADIEEGSCCPICLEPLLLQKASAAEVANAPLRIGAAVPCGHCFHTKCWKQSFDSAARQGRSNVNNCPTCNVKTKLFMRLYLNAPGKVKPVPPTSVAKGKAAKRPPTTGKSNPAHILGNSHAPGSESSLRFGTSTTVLPLAGSSSPLPSFHVDPSMGAQPRPVGLSTQGFPFPQSSHFNPSSTVATSFPAPVLVPQPFQFGTQGSGTSPATGNVSTGLTSPSFHFASNGSASYATTTSSTNPLANVGVPVYPHDVPPQGIAASPLPWMSAPQSLVLSVQVASPIFQIGVGSGPTIRRRITRARRPRPL
jgi:Zinc finger, C3HC4 type (RING finger)